MFTCEGGPGQGSVSSSQLTPNVKVGNIPRMRMFTAGMAAALAAVIAIANLDAVTRVPSADGQFWDIQDTSPWAQDSGGIATGGRANPFNGFGYLKLQVRRADSTLLARNQYLRGFGLHHDGAGRFDSVTPVLTEGILISRGVTTSKDTQYTATSTLSPMPLTKRHQEITA